MQVKYRPANQQRRADFCFIIGVRKRRKLWRRITHILIDAPYVPDGYAAMSIEPVVIEEYHPS